MGAKDNPIRIDTSLDRVTDWMDDVVRTTALVEKRGRVSAVAGGLVRATVTGVRIADLCVLSGGGDAAPGEDVLAEVVGFDRQHVLIVAFGVHYRHLQRNPGHRHRKNARSVRSDRNSSARFSMASVIP